MFVFCPQILDIFIAGYTFILQWQEFHREIYAFEFASRDGQVARLFGTASEYRRIKFFQQLHWCNNLVCPIVNAFAGTRGADKHTGAENNPFCLHLLKAPVDMRFFHLEIRDAVAQQPANAVIFLEHGYRMSSACELLCTRETGRAGADDRYFFPGFMCGRLRPNPALVPAFIHNRMFDRFDANRVGIDTQRACLFAWRGTNTTGEFRKIISRMQCIERTLPVLPINKIVPVGDDVVYRAASYAERDAAIHAARALNFRFFVRQVVQKFSVMPDAFTRRFRRLMQALKFHESGYFSHKQTCGAAATQAAILRVFCASSPSARLYSCGNTLMNFPRMLGQSSRVFRARELFV